MAQTYHRYRAGDRPVGGYKLIRKLGEGGFGEVWQASAPGGAEVALKFIDLTGQQGFREFKSLRLVKKITHNNLTPLHGFWLKNEDGTLIDESDVTWSQLAPSFPGDPAASPSSSMATAVFTHPVELIVAMGLGKKSLYDRLRECKDEGLGGIPADELLDYMEDAAKGIDYLNRPIHDMGHGPNPIVHSDVKPHNILIVGDGAQVCDFGLAHAVESLRKTCQAPLTLAYAAPESFRGKPCDKSDQYSLAITYVELRTGLLPFDDTLTGYEVMTAHVQGLLDLSRLTPSEASVIKKATSSMPQDRWRSCREMIVELRRALRLSTDSNFMMDPADAPASRLSGPVPTPDRTRTMQPPGFPAAETSPFSGPTPSTVDPALRTRTPTSVTPVVVSSGTQQGETASQGGFSTRAKLLLSMLALAICAGGGYAIWGPWDLSSIVRKVENEKDEKKDKVVQTGNADEDFDRLLKAEQFAAAFDLLPKFTSEKRPKKGEELRTAWRNHADGLFNTGTYAAALSDYVDLAERFPQTPDLDDLKLMQARAQVGMGSFAAAGKVLSNLTVPAERANPRDRMYFLIKVLAEIEGEKKLDRLTDLYTVWQEHRGKGATPTAARGDRDLWTITADEVQKLENARSAVVGKWLQSADIRSAKAQASDLEAIEKIVQIDPNNVDAWIVKADLHLELGPPAELDKALKRRASLGGKPNDVPRRGTIVDAYWDLTNPSSSGERIVAALDALPRLMSRFKDRRMALATAARDLAKRQDKYLADAVAALRDAAEDSAADGKLKEQFAELLALAIPQRLSKEANFAQAAPQLLRDCQFVAAAYANVDDVPEVIRACHAECLLELGTGDARQVIGADGTTAYYHYVRARAFAGRGGDRAQVDTSLKFLFADKRPAIMDLAGRTQKAIELVNEVADEARGPARSFKVGDLLNNPVEPTPQSRLAYELLLKAYSWTEPSLLSTSARANLAIASWWMNQQSKLPTDGDLARKLSLEIAPEWLKNRSSTNVNPQLALSLFHTLLASYSDVKDEGVEALRMDAAREMMKLAGESKLDDADVQSLYAAVVRPLVGLASRNRVHAFFAEAAGLIEQYPKLNWKFDAPGGSKAPSVPEKLEELYTLAIAASGGKVGDYFKHRAEARLKRQPTPYDAVLGDATELKRFDEFKAQALALEGHMRYLRSRDAQVSPTHADRVKELELAYKSLQEAEHLANNAHSLSKQDRAQLWLILSYIHTERGNFAGLFDKRRVIPAEEFKKAVEFAEKVINEGGGLSLEYAYEAAANGYEDLAWHAHIDPEANFAKAIEHLTNSLAVNSDSPDAHMALARSYYKMVVEMRPPVNPPKLGRTIAQHLDEARRQLATAITLAGEGKTPEAHYWLGKVIQASHVDDRTPLEKAQTLLTVSEYRAADEQFTKAIKAADALNISKVYRLTYAMDSAEHALFNPDLKQQGGNAKLQAINAIYQRAKQLAALNVRTPQVDPVQEAKIFQARADLKGGSTIDKVLNSLDKDALEIVSTKDERNLTASDGKLIDMRLNLADDLRPDQLAKPRVEMIVKESLWCADAPGNIFSVSRRVAALATAMKLSRQMAAKDGSYANSSVQERRDCLKLLARLPIGEDYNRHLFIINEANETMKAAAKQSPQVLGEIRSASKAFVEKAIDSARKSKRSDFEVQQLNTLLALFK